LRLPQFRFIAYLEDASGTILCRTFSPQLARFMSDLAYKLATVRGP
jgi:hypothetical protein